MKTFKFTLYSLVIIAFLASCAKVYQSPDAKTLARKHKTFAILPPSVSIAARKKVDPSALIEQQKTESINFQKEIYSWMLKRKTQGKILQEIQDIETTNAILLKNGYPATPMTPSEICEILNVDGIMTSNFSMTKPMSEGAAIAVGLLVGVWGTTNEVHASIKITDCENHKMIWNYDHKYSGGVGSSPARLVDGLMRNSSKKMPYFIQKEY